MKSSLSKTKKMDRIVSPSDKNVRYTQNEFAGAVRIAGVRFDNLTMEETVSRIVEIVQKADTPQHVCTGNLDHLAMLQKDDEFRAIYDNAALVLADGMPIVWLSRLAARRGAALAPLKERVAGSDLFWELGRASAHTGLRIFLLGGMEGAAECASAVLKERHPGAVICGIYCPPHSTFHTDEEQERIQQIIRAASPDVLMVGLGAPKQEKWIARYKDALGAPVCIGVGGSFEMAAGMVKRAPSWVQKVGMEWICRMLQDPRRLTGRYLGRDLPFLFRALSQTLRQQRPNDDSDDDPTPMQDSDPPTPSAAMVAPPAPFPPRLPVARQRTRAENTASAMLRFV
jgi:N-acetylglucosaminyldiphosphoundecaprenol N-acetyl-beta-D-mannosaminyltransferase